MKAILTVKMDNAAFESRPDLELARILRALAEHVEDLHFTGAYDCDVKVHDINGNTVGELKVTT